jgi:hypothetical protein
MCDRGTAGIIIEMPSANKMCKNEN